MARINNLTDFLTDVATAIKTKTGKSTNIPAADFDTEIMSIETPGVYQEKNIIITENGNYNLLPDTGYDAISNVRMTIDVEGSAPMDPTTATANDVISPKTFYSNGQKLTGAIIPTYESNVLFQLTKENEDFYNIPLDELTAYSREAVDGIDDGDLPAVLRTFSEASWSDINKIANSNRTYYNATEKALYVDDFKFCTLGDTKTDMVTYNSNNQKANMTFRIIGINHDTKSDGSGKAVLTIQFTSHWPNVTQRHMSSLNNAGGWKNSLCRTWLNSTGVSWLPSELSSVIKSVDKLSGKGGQTANPASDGGLNTTSDKLFLLSDEEMLYNFTSDGTSTAEEGTKYAWYTDGGTPYKGSNNWTRSSRYSGGWNQNHFIMLNTSGSMACSDVTNYLAIVPVFCI